MKKGFTLIELLAVIVILAVLALIATPIVLNIIDDSKKNATLRSSENYIKAIEFSIAKSVMENKRLSDGTYPIMSNGSICLGTLTGSTCSDTLVVEVAGETPESGNITIKSRKIDSYEFTYKSGFVVVNGQINSDSAENNLTLAQFILKQAKDNNYYYTTTPDFSKVTQDGEYGLYKLTDNYGTSYYFRGDTEDNYVQFGGRDIDSGYYVFIDHLGTEEIDIQTEFVFETLEECENSSALNNHFINANGECRFVEEPTQYTNFWRIVQIYSNNTIKLIYDGKEKKHNSVSRDVILNYSSYFDLNLYTWYEQNVLEYDSYVVNHGYCREIYSESMNRLQNFSPNLICADNQKVESKFSNLTADEAMYAGLVYNKSNINNYLYTGNLYQIYNSDIESGFIIVDETGKINTLESDYFSDGEGYIDRPVIVLRSDVSFTGNGSYDNPYVIVTN